MLWLPFPFFYYGQALLPVQLEHILFLDTLSLYHRDPFDRILIAQAISEGLILLSYDSTFAQYPVQVEW